MTNERLRAGMPIAVIAQIRSRSRIVRPVPLHAVGGSVITLGRRHDGDHAAIVIIAVVIIARIGGVVARAAIIALRRDRAPDHGAGNARGKARTDAAAVMIAAATEMARTATVMEITASGMEVATGACLRCTAMGRVGKTGGRHRQRQSQRHDGGGTQYFKTDHYRLL